MNELGNIGFTYDIKTFTPDGEKKDDFSVHNLITDEGLRWVVARIFAKNTPLPSFASGYHQSVYGDLDIFSLSFMTKKHTPNKTFDSHPTFTTDVGEADLTNKLANCYLDTYKFEQIFESNRRIRFLVKNINTSTNTISFYQEYDSYSNFHGFYFKCINTTLLLTGVFMTATNNRSLYTLYNNSSSAEGNLLLSEAMFPEPILLEVGGKLQVNCGCTVISA